MKKLLLAIAFVLVASADSGAQGCYGPGCGGASVITPTTPTTGFTANTLIRSDGTNFLSGPKFLSGNLSLEVGTNYCPDAGANDTYVCTLQGGSLSAYSTGTKITLKANTANTGTATVAVDGLAAITITRRDDSTLQTGDITAGEPVELVYDGNTFRMQGGFASGMTYAAGVFATTNNAAGAFTVGGLADSGTFSIRSAAGGRPFSLTDSTNGHIYGNCSATAAGGTAAGCNWQADGNFGINFATSLYIRGGSVNALRFNTSGLAAAILDMTVTAAATTGAQTINKLAGSVNFAAAATTLVVTNSLAGASSLIFLTPQTADTTCIAFSAVRAAGSFTITANAACTAETAVAFLVTN